MTQATASETRVDQIADGIHRISTPSDLIPGGFTFNQFLIADREPLLFHTGLRKMFPAVKEAVSRVLPVESLRYIAFSHVEADECGSLNEFLAAAPHAVPVCSRTAALVSVNDMADRPPRPMADGEVLSLGSRRVRWFDCPHLPHGWETGYLGEETTGTLLCGDLFTHPGSDVPPMTEGDILTPSEGMRKAMDYYAHAKDTRPLLERLAAFNPKVLGLMHGSSWRGDGRRLLLDLAAALER